MDRILNSIALVGGLAVIAVVSFVSFHPRGAPHPYAGTVARPLAAQVPTPADLPDGTRHNAGEAYSLTPKASPPAAKPAPVAAPAAAPVSAPVVAPKVVATAPAKPKSPPPPPVPASYNSIDDLIKSVFAAQGSGAVAWALRVADCESGDNPRAYNPAGYMGLFQFDRGTWNGTPYASGNPYDAATNARAAAWLYARRGPQPWGCSYM